MVAPRRDARRLLLAVLALLGLLAMHGLDAHGVTASPSATPTAAGGSAADHPAGGHGASGHVGDSPDEAPTEHGGHSLVMGLCLALLVAACVLLAPRLRPRWFVGRAPRSSVSRPRLLAMAAPARPPDLVALGVCRC